MNARQIAKFRKLLEAKKAELAWEMQKTRERLLVSASAEPLDRVRNRTERELAVRDLNLQADLLQKVTDALREIQDGTFGECVSCGREIARKRLEAVPWSPYCLSCQEQAEIRQEPQSDREELATQTLAS
jgi:DnaK suppressor protein